VQDIAAKLIEFAYCSTKPKRVPFHCPRNVNLATNSLTVTDFGGQPPAC